VESVNVVTDEKHFPQSLNATGHELVEDVVGSLQRLLRDDTGLLKQVCDENYPISSSSLFAVQPPQSIQNQLTGFNVSSGQFSRVTEVDTDEFTLLDCIENVKTLTRFVQVSHLGAT